MKPTLTATSGTITIGRRTATYVYGSFKVILPEGQQQAEQEDRLQNGYIYRPDNRPSGRFDVGFVRADATIDLTSGQSDLEEVVDAAQKRVEGDVFFETDISGPSLGHWRPDVDYTTGDVLPVIVCGKTLQLPVTKIDMTSSVADPSGWRVHVGGQLISDAETLRRHNSDIEAQIASEKRQRLREAGAIKEIATTAKSTADTAKVTADSAVVKADAAQAVADAKSRNFYGPSTPVGAKAGDSWFRQAADGRFSLWQFRPGTDGVLRWVEAVPKVDLTGVQADLSQVKLDLDAAEAELATLKPDLAAVESAQADAQVALEKAQADVASAQQSVDALKATVADLPTDADVAAAVAGKVDSAVYTQKMQQLDSDLSAAKGNISTLQSSLSTLDGKLAAANADIAKKVNTADYQAKMSQLDASLSSQTLDLAKKINRGDVQASDLVAGAVTAGSIAAGAVVAGKIAADAVTATEIASGAVTTAELAAGAVTAGKIAAGAVVAGKIAARAVSTNELAARAVTASKLMITPANGVFNPTFVNGNGWRAAGGTAQFNTNTQDPTGWATLTPGATTDAYLYNSLQNEAAPVGPGRTIRLSATVSSASNLGANTVWVSCYFYDENGNYVQTPGKYWANSIPANTPTLVSAQVTVPATARRALFRIWVKAGQPTVKVESPTLVDAVDASLIVDGSILARHITTGAVETDKLAANAVTAGKIDANAITAREIQAGTITGTEIKGGSVTSDKLLVANGFINSAMIADAAITSAKIGDLAVSSAKIADGSILTAKIADGSILTAKIADAQIVGAKIADAAISTAKIQDAAITNAKIANLDAGKITTGTLDAQRIGAGSITADKIAVDSLSAREIKAEVFTQVGSNLLPLEPGTVNGAWTANRLATGTDDTVYQGFRWYSFDKTYAAKYANMTQVDPTLDYDFTVWLKGTNGSRLYVELRDQDNNRAVESGGLNNTNPAGAQGGSAYLVAGMTLPTAWTKYTTRVKLKPGVRAVRIGAIYGSYSSGPAGVAYIGDMALTQHQVPQAEIDALQDAAIRARPLLDGGAWPEWRGGKTYCDGRLSVVTTNLERGVIITPQGSWTGMLIFHFQNQDGFANEAGAQFMPIRVTASDRGPWRYTPANGTHGVKAVAFHIVLD